MGFKSAVMIKTKLLMQLHKVMNVWVYAFWLLGRFVMHLS